MAILKPGAVAAAAAVAALLSTSTVLAAPSCIPKPSATFELTADAPGTAIEGLKIFGLPATSHLLEMFPSNPASLSQGSTTFYKNDTTHLYIIAQDYAAANPNVAAPELIVVPADGDVMFTSDPASYDFGHYEEYFTATIDVWPPSSHIDFKPGEFLNPGDLGPYGPAPGGWFACYDALLEDYQIWLGTEQFIAGAIPGSNATTCISFMPKVNLLNFEVGC